MEYLAKPSTRLEAEWSIWQSLVLGRTQNGVFGKEWSIWQSLVLGRTENRVGYSPEPSARPDAE